MASLTNYKGLQVITPDPVGDGGLAINNDFKSLVDWNPKSNWSATVNPTETDDSSDDFQVGSRWFNTNTGAMFICVDATTSAAIWRPVPIGAIGLTAWNTTTNNTTTQLYLDGVDDPIVVPELTTWGYTITVVAQAIDESTDPDELIGAVWEVRGAVRRENTGGAALIGANNTSTWKDTNASSWTLTVTVSGNNLQINATGVAGLTVDWLANIKITPIS